MKNKNSSIINYDELLKQISNISSYCLNNWEKSEQMPDGRLVSGYLNSKISDKFNFIKKCMLSLNSVFKINEFTLKNIDDQHFIIEYPTFNILIYSYEESFKFLTKIEIYI